MTDVRVQQRWSVLGLAPTPSVSLLLNLGDRVDSPTDAANAIGMGERGERDPRLSTLIAIARAISALTGEHVTAADLIRAVE